MAAFLLPTHSSHLPYHADIVYVIGMDTLTRFLTHIDKNQPDFKDLGPCWKWTKATQQGYGIFTGPKRKQYKAHRFAYLSLVGPIPEGLQLDHLCRNRDCVNPDHLEPVTGKINKLRGKTVNQANSLKTHCPNGHPYNEINTYFSHEGKRSCRVCQRNRLRKGHTYMSPAIVIAIRNAVGTQAQIAEQFEVSQATVSRIKLGQQWRSVSG